MSDTKCRELYGLGRVLNGIVGRESGSSSGSDISITDLQYEFFYSISENGDDDRIFYDFDTFPTENKLDIDQVEGNSRNVSRKISAHSKASVVSFAGTVKCNENDNQRMRKQKSLDQNSETDLHETPAIVPCERSPNNDGPNPGSKLNIRRHKSSSSAGSYRNQCYSRQQSLSSVGTGRSRTELSDVTDKTTTTKEALQRKKSVCYDPALDKASAFLHTGGKSFSRANTTLTPVRYGLKHLQTNYTEANLENNNSRIFLDLLKSSHQKNYIRNTAIRNLETRLEIKRNNPHFFTSFYDHNKIPDPLGRNSKKNAARSVAQKKLERREKIKTTTDELHLGYIPTVLTMKQTGQIETEEIGKRCRYLRCRSRLPNRQPSYNSGRPTS